MISRQERVGNSRVGENAHRRLGACPVVKIGVDVDNVPFMRDKEDIVSFLMSDNPLGLPAVLLLTQILRIPAS